MGSELPNPHTEFGGRYLLGSVLASGGMGAVYEATVIDTDTAVAIKILLPSLAEDPSIRRRFRRESSVLAAIQHPGIVRVLDYGTDDDAHCFTVMELLRGETLEARLRRQSPLSLSTLAPIVDSICAALTVVHEHGVIHGDLKPAHVVLTSPTHPFQAKLVDFGLAKVFGLERLTRTGEAVGTPQYMAPELLTGEQPPDERVDVYSLGIMLFEALTGQHPFPERNPGRLVFDIALGRRPSLGERAQGLPEGLVAAVEASMAIRPQDRRFTPRELARRLRDAAG